MNDRSSFLTTPVAILIGAVVISIAILLHGGVIKLGNLATTGTGTPAAALPSIVPQAPIKATVSLGRLPTKGNSSAKVAVVEFADFRCPFCEKFFTATESQLLKDYVDSGKVKFAFRHFQFLGPASITAGNAAECANEQGKFWDYHDWLYKNQPPESDTSMYTTDKLTAGAQTLGMDGSKFSSCLSSTKYANNVTGDQADGTKIGVNGTPTFIVGKVDGSGNVSGTLLVGAQPYSAFQQAIDPLLK